MYTILIILSIVLILAVLLKIFVPEKQLQSLAHVSTIIGGLGAGFSLAWAAYTYYNGAQLQKALAASNIYQEHMKLSIENPDLSDIELVPKPTDSNSTVEEKKHYEKYEWYVGHALYSLESILDVYPNDTAWKKTAADFIIDHKAYISSNNFPCDRYSINVQKLIEEVIHKKCP